MIQDNRVKSLISELADIMKAVSDAGKPAEPQAPIDIEAALIAQYRDKPLPPLSAELRAKLGACIPRIE